MTFQAEPTYCLQPDAPDATYCPLYTDGHKYSEWCTIQSLSCTDFQVETRSCECGYGVVRRTDELGHKMSEFVVVQDPTCIEPGHETSTCERCAKTETRILEALGHNWGEWTKIQSQSCVNEEIQEHACTACGLTETQTTAKPTGHKYGEWKITQTMTCTNDEIKTRVCTICQYEDHSHQSAPGHKYTSFEQTKAPTCSNTGTKQRTCTVCGYVDKQDVAKLGHSYENGYCVRCGTEHPDHWPKTYQDSGVKITIYKITGYGGGNTTCYVADVQLTDYTRFFTACGKNKYGGQSGTQAAAKLQNAVLAINGCYSAPYLDYTVVRRGIIYNGANRNLWLPAVYSSNTGLFSNVWEGQRNELAGKNVQALVDAGLVTDTFCFGPPILVDGVVTGGTGGGRAQRTFIGTNGKPGHLLLCVSNGRYSDGVSAGLTYQEMGQLMKDYGCNFGIPLDGGGSSTMVFKGQVLNQLANGQERTWIVDFCCVGY
ncbi:MAG: phosphodiester glycosidase family protein [Bacteroidaceae bacterium]|nr:phosphodiester glycosidase family protein [Bacteroidaceae bacterium]